MSDWLPIEGQRVVVTAIHPKEKSPGCQVGDVITVDRAGPVRTEPSWMVVIHGMGRRCAVCKVAAVERAEVAMEKETR